ncbi:hypothetical protein ACRE0J_11335, partial [Streptococcus pneumoniae]
WKNKWKLEALSATSIAGGFLVFLYEKNWLEAIIKSIVSGVETPDTMLFLYQRLFAQFLKAMH